MESKVGRPIFYSSNMVNLCIDIWRREGPCGRLYHQYTAEAIPFRSLYEVLDGMNQLYDMLQYPEASAAFRSFTPNLSKTDTIAELPERKGMQKKTPEQESLKQVMENRGSAATFMIHVRYRQHFSWQGEITWVDKRQKRSFRSVWELARLIYSAQNPEIKHTG